MRVQLIKFLVGIVFVLFAGTIVFAQDPEMVRHFDYDETVPLDLTILGTQKRGDVYVLDITYASPKGGVVPAYLVVPSGKGPFAGVIWGHWYWRNSDMRNRKQFLDEAVALAEHVAIPTTRVGIEGFAAFVLAWNSCSKSFMRRPRSPSPACRSPPWSERRGVGSARAAAGRARSPSDR